MAVAGPVRGVGFIACANDASRGGPAGRQLLGRLVGMIAPA